MVASNRVPTFLDHFFESKAVSRALWRCALGNLIIQNIVSANLFALKIDSSLLRMPSGESLHHVNPPAQPRGGNKP